MRGSKIIYIGLGRFLREQREKSGYNLDTAAMMIGLTSGSYLAACEVGRSNFPFKSLKRASELYGTSVEKIVKAATEDYQSGLLGALK